jgi:Fe-S-cluster containining protein
MTTPEPKFVTVDFKFAVGDGSFGASLTVPEGQCNLTEILPVLQSFDDSLLTAISEQLGAEGLSVSCKAGCGACCRQMVPLSIFEAEALAAWIATMDPATREILAQRFHQALLKLASGGIIDRLVTEDWLADTDSARQLALDYFYQRVPCPFLQDESCSIHPIRPLVCREYLVTSDPIHCARLDPLEVKRIPVPVKVSETLIYFRDGRGTPEPTAMPLVSVLDWAAKHCDDPQPSIPAVELFQNFLKEFAGKDSVKGLA